MKMANEIKRMLGVGLVGLVLTSGCAKLQNQIARDGSIIGSTNGNYVVVQYSGPEIVNLWKLKDVHVQSEEQSDGWLFQDAEGNVVNIAGAVKVMRMSGQSQDVWNSYHEYHKELQSKSYTEMYGK
jgi:hypothetical protein